MPRPNPVTGRHPLIILSRFSLYLGKGPVKNHHLGSLIFIMLFNTAKHGPGLRVCEACSTPCVTLSQFPVVSFHVEVVRTCCDHVGKACRAITTCAYPHSCSSLGSVPTFVKRLGIRKARADPGLTLASLGRLKMRDVSVTYCYITRHLQSSWPEPATGIHWLNTASGAGRMRTAHLCPT